MNFYDVNVSLGGWPFRHVPRHSALEVRADLEKLGCLGALAANNGSVLYNDTREANRELAAAIAPHRDFFFGCATINPLWPQPEKELALCVREWDFRALRLLPRYHDYDLSQAAALAEKAGELGVPVIVPAEIVNFRQRHRLEPETALTFGELAELAVAVPGATFIWLDGVLPGDAPGNVYGEFNRGLPDLAAGTRLLLGTGTPLRSPAALLKCEQWLAAEPALLQKVTQDNFRQLFG